MKDLDRKEFLRIRILQLNHEYYTLSNPSSTDAEYDSLVKEYVALGGKMSSVQEATTTQEKVKHKRPMLSLDNAFSAADVTKFFKAPAGTLYVYEPKIDGLAVSLHYHRGHLTKASTRGDGTHGDDATANANVVANIPKVIPTSLQDVEIRGEIFMFHKDFEDLNKELIAEGDEPFSNPRNAASGSFKLKDHEECARRKLSFIAYQTFGFGHANHVTAVKELTDLGFLTTQQTFMYGTTDLTSLDELIKNLQAMKPTMAFDIDGFVLKINDYALRDELGTGSKSPKWALAFKFPEEKKIATLLDITLHVGRVGTITPVAHLSPTTIGGAVVRKASLCNFDEINRLSINIGDQVEVVRSAEVIPKVVGLHQKNSSGTFQPPKVCPCCHQALTKLDEFVAYRCTNTKGCTEQIFQRISHAVSKSCLDWDGCGEVQVRELMAIGNCLALSDVLKVDPSWMTPSAREKFLAQREVVKKAPFWKKLHALGFEGVGRTFSKSLASKYSNILAIADDFKGVEAIVGPGRVHKFFAELSDLSGEIEALDAVGFKFEAEKREGPTTKATGKTFVITGTLLTGGRDDVSAKVEKAGGIIKSSVGKTTDYLVVGEAPGGNKTKAAEKYGTHVISEEELYELIGEQYVVSEGVDLDAL